MYQIRKTFESSSSQKQYSETEASGKTDISPFYSKKIFTVQPTYKGMNVVYRHPPLYLQFCSMAMDPFLSSLPKY
jgi:hypothetical protein